MLKKVKAIARSSAVLILAASGMAISGAAQGEILSQVTPPPALPVDDSIICYMQTSQGITLNLNNLCGRNADTPNRSIAVSQTNERIPPGLVRYSNTSNGVTCVAIDQQGRPCQGAQ